MLLPYQDLIIPADPALHQKLTEQCLVSDSSQGEEFS